jgi:hypothetical protein
MIDRIKELETINKPKTKLEIAKELVKELEWEERIKKEKVNFIDFAEEEDEDVPLENY